MSRPQSGVCVFAGVLGVLVVALPGCSQPPAVDPWHDDAIPTAAGSSPSRDGILAAGHAPAMRHRDQAPEIVFAAQTAGTPHYPLWWEDPFEDKGDGDGQFAWTWADYLAMPYSFGRYLLNTMGWPVSAVVTPPGTSMVSDGQVAAGRDHDAQVGTSPDPQAEFSDFGQLLTEPAPEGTALPLQAAGSNPAP